jgi:SAM-dependent methyltransferase
MPERDALIALYEALARWRWWARTLRRAPAGAGLELHKRLLPARNGDGGPGPDGLEPWLLRKVAAAPPGAVLDVGCGLGSTLFRCARARDGALHGVSTCAFAVAKARAEAARLGLAGRCTFALHDYDRPLAGRFALLLAIEALFHAPELARTLRNLAAAAQPGALLAVCEDMAAGELDGDADAVVLREAWATPRLHAVADYRRALAAAGFVLLDETDLTAQVRTAPPAALARRARRLAAARLLPSRWLRRVAQAYRGGVALERLYGGGAMRYVAMVARRAQES